MLKEFSLKIPLRLGIALSALSGLLLAASMPGFDVPFVGWFALVPLLIVLMSAETKRVYILALPFGIVFSIGVHSWYPYIFQPVVGYILIIAVGTYYAGLLHLGTWLYTRLPSSVRIFAFPVSWAAVEFLKYITPGLRDWWFVLLAKSSWRFSPALQILSITGFPGLSFMLMLANTAIAALILSMLKQYRRKADTAVCVLSLLMISAVLILGAISIPDPPEKTFTIAALTDLVNQDPVIRDTGDFDGTSANSEKTSLAIFKLDAGLTKSAAPQHPDFVVWPENEIADADNPDFITKLGDLASAIHSYIVADVIWNTSEGMHDAALMVSPSGTETGRRAKINITEGEKAAGFVPGPPDYPVFSTPYGEAGLAVCWDRHRLNIIRSLARNGADIVLLPVDDDFSGNSRFPPFHASDGIFRAAENHVAMGLGTTNGLSLIADPYGRITAEGEINKRGVTVGKTFSTVKRTVYTRFGDWFGWTLVMTLAALIIAAKSRLLYANSGGTTEQKFSH